MTSVGEASILITADVKGFSTQLNKGIKGAVGGLGKIGLGAGTAFAGGLAVGTGQAISQFADFEQGISEVFSLLGGDADVSTLDGIEQATKDLATTFGLDLQDAIGGVYDSISAGVDTSDLESFEAFTEGAAQFAAAGATDFGTSIDLLTTATNAFGLEQADVAKTSDILFATIKSGKTTADELAASLFQVAPIAASSGVSLGETSAALASLTAQGVPTAAAATQIKGAFAELSKSGTVADKAFRDIAGQGFTQFLEGGGSVQEAFNLMRESADDSGISVADLFGSLEGGSAILGLTGDQADRFSDNLEAINGSAGATGDAFELMDSTLAKSFDRIRSTFAVALVDIGDQLRPFVATIAGFVEERLPQAVEFVIGAVSGLTTRLGPVFGQVTAFFKTLFSGFTEDEGSPIEDFALGVRSAFQGLTDQLGGGDGLGSVFDKIRDTAVQLAPVVATLGVALGTILGANAAATKDIFATLAPILLDLAVAVLPPLAAAVTVIAETFSAIVASTPVPVLSAVAAAFLAINLAMKAQAASLAVAGLFKYIKGIGLVTKATSVWTAVQKGLNLSLLANPVFLSVAAVVALGAALVVAYKNSETFRRFVDRLGAALKPVLGAIKLVGSAFKDIFTGDFAGAFDKLGEVGDILKSVFADLGGIIGPVLEDLGRNAIRYLGVGLTAAGGALGTVFGKLIDNLPDIGRAFLGLGRKAIGLLGEGMSAAAGAVTGAIRSVFASVGLEGVFDTAGTVLRAVFDGYVTYLRGVWKVISTVVKVGIAAVGKTLSGIRNLWDTGFIQGVFSVAVAAVELAWAAIKGHVQIGVKIVGGIISGVKSAWDTGALQAIWGGVVAAVKAAWESIKESVDVGVAVVGGIIAGVRAVWDTGALQTIWDGIVAAFGLAWDSIKGAVETGVTIVGGIIDGIRAAWNLGVLQAIWDGISAAFELAWSAISAAVQIGVDAVEAALGFFGIGSDGGSASQDGPGGLSKVFDAVASAFDLAWSAITKVIEVAMAVITPIIDLFKAAIEGLVIVMEAAEAGFRTVWGAISGFFTETIPEIAASITGPFEAAAAGVSEIWEAFKSGIGIIWDAISNVFGDKVEAIRSVVVGKFEDVANGASIVWETFRATIGGVWDGIKTTFTTKVQAIDTTVRNILGALKDWISGLFAGVGLGNIDVSGITGPVDTVISALGRAVDAINVFNGKQVKKVDLTGIADDTARQPGNLPSSSTGRLPGPTDTLRFFAQGGFVNRFTRSVIGEDGPELVLPLSKPGRMRELLAKYGEAVTPYIPSDVIPSSSGLAGSIGNGSNTPGRRRRGVPQISIAVEELRKVLDRGINVNHPGIVGEPPALAAAIRSPTRDRVTETPPAVTAVAAQLDKVAASIAASSEAAKTATVAAVAKIPFGVRELISNGLRKDITADLQTEIAKGIAVSERIGRVQQRLANLRMVSGLEAETTRLALKAELVTLNSSAKSQAAVTLAAAKTAKAFQDTQRGRLAELDSKIAATILKATEDPGNQSINDRLERLINAQGKATDIFLAQNPGENTNNTRRIGEKLDTLQAKLVAQLVKSGGEENERTNILRDLIQKTLDRTDKNVTGPAATEAGITGIANQVAITSGSQVESLEVINMNLVAIGRELTAKLTTINGAVVSHDRVLAQIGQAVTGLGRPIGVLSPKLTNIAIGIQRTADAVRQVHFRLGFKADALRVAIVTTRTAVVNAINGIRIPAPVRPLTAEFAQGGFVDRATNSIVGEDGTELVLPLTKQRRLNALVSQAMAFPAFTDALNATGAIGGMSDTAVNRPAFRPTSSSAPTRTRTSNDNSTTINHFYGAEASEVARRQAEQDRAIVQGLRVRS